MFKLRGIYVGRFLRIPVYLHPTWFIMLFFLTYGLANAFAAEGEVSATVAWTAGLVTALLGFASLLAHEYGHALAARWFGIPTQRITLFLLGGIAQIRGELRNPTQELVIALAGPLVSVVCMVIFGVLWLAVDASDQAPVVAASLGNLAVLNFVFAAFNMLPGFPMDGGRVLRALVWAASGNYLTATRVAFAGGVAVACMLIAWGVFGFLSGTGGILPALTGFFLIYIARESLREAQMKAAFDHVTVRDLMRPVQAVVPADMPLRSVVQEYVYRIHSERFPVVRGNMLLGYISADDIAAVDRAEWDQRRAEQYVRPFGRAEILTPETNALHALQKVQSLGRAQLPVFRNRELVGYLFLQDIVLHMRRFQLS